MAKKIFGYLFLALGSYMAFSIIFNVLHVVRSSQIEQAESTVIGNITLMSVVAVSIAIILMFIGKNWIKGPKKTAT